MTVTRRYARPHIYTLLAATLLALVLTGATALSTTPQVMQAGAGQESFPAMHPDDETFAKWMRSYERAPMATAVSTAPAIAGAGGSVDLLPHLSYVPSERSQGSCGNCWAWAGTGCMEIALDMQTGIYDRLSVQYLNSCEYPITFNPCCTGGWLSAEFVTFYGATHRCIPWSNTNASWQDRDAGCDVPCGTIATEPYYPIADIAAVTVPTHAGEGVPTDEAAIASIKSVLDSGKAVWFAFFVPSTTAWSRFTSFWLNNGEEVVCDLDAICSGTGRWGGHAVLCVGYDDSDPDNRYWVMLNSWGTANGMRPNGLFRVDMDMDYDTTCLGYAFFWQTLDVSFGISPLIGVSPTSLSCSVLQHQTEELSFTIENFGEADLEFSVTDGDTPWLTEVPGDGIVVPAEQRDIIVTVDASGLAAGDREAAILICSNDPASSAVTLPLTVTVLPAPDLAPAVLCAEWEAGGTDTYLVTLAVTNEGEGTAAASTARLFIDGAEVASYNVPPLEPSGMFAGTYGPVLLSDGEDELSLLVDTEDEVSPEGDEGNNALLQSVGAPETGHIELVLAPGWNMVSVPLRLTDPTTAAAFPGAEAVYAWNAVSKSYAVPSVIQPDRAYWVAVLQETPVTLEGLAVAEYVANLDPGWHMLGSVYGTSAMFEDPQDAPAGSVEGLAYHWNASSKAYDLRTEMSTGEGYWVAASTECLLEVS